VAEQQRRLMDDMDAGDREAMSYLLRGMDAATRDAFVKVSSRSSSLCERRLARSEKARSENEGRGPAR
jgi:hypothetical protein